MERRPDATILVLEDDQSLREILLECLEDAGYVAQGAGGAQEALTLSSRTRFDLVISDVRMAGPVDGLGVLETLKRVRPDLKCLVITGFADEQAPGRAVNILVDDYLYKPFESEELLKVVRRVLWGEDGLYKRMVKALLGAPKKLRDKAEAMRRDSAVKQWESARARLLQGYFVAVRSKLLTRGAALDVWDRLEPLEVVDVIKAETPAIAELAGQHGVLFEMLTAMTRSSSVGTHRPRGPGQVDGPTFNRFFSRLQGGQITPDQLGLAAHVRRMTPAARQDRPEAQSLFETMWA